MHSHIAIELLKILNEEEIKLLGDFIRSPYFNKREVLIRLYDLVAKHSPDFTNSSLKKENLYKKLFPGKEYNEQTLRSRISDFSNLIKIFIIENKFRSDTTAQKKYFISEMTKRKKFELSEKHINEAIAEMEVTPNYGEEFFSDKFSLLTQHVSLWLAMDQKINALNSAYERSELFLNQSLMEIMKINNDIVCYEIETKNKPEFSFASLFLENFNFEGYLNTLMEMDYKHYPLIASYFYGNLSMYKPEEEKYFYKLKDIIYKYHSKFEMMELYNLWSILSNCVYTNYLSKGIKFMHEGNEINKFFINNELYDKNKPFSALGYQNILMNALLVNDLDWGEEFIDTFKNKLAPEVVTNRYHFCKALIYFERKDYNGAIGHLNFVKYTDWDLKINTRLNYLKNYYELGISDQVDSLIDSIRHYLTKNVDMFPEYAHLRFKNTLNHISKMSNAKFSGKKLDYADYMEAEKSEEYLHKTWILEKMKDLI